MKITKPKLLICACMVFGVGGSMFPQVVRASDEFTSPKIIWSCRETRYVTGENVLWLVDWGEQSYVKVFDQRIPAEHSYRGLEQRWDFGFGSDRVSDYAVILEPNGVAAYYDFSMSDDGKATASAVYFCSK